MSLVNGASHHRRLRKPHPNSTKHQAHHQVHQQYPFSSVGAWPTHPTRTATMTTTTSERPPQPRPPLATQTHSRTSSFFSFRNRPTDTGPQRSVSNVTRPSSNVNSNTYGFDEFGRPRLGELSRGNSPQQQNLQAQQMTPPQQQQPQQPQQPGTTRGPTNQAPEPRNTSQPNTPFSTQNLHPEIRSLVQLTVSHTNKVYFSGPLVRRIERQTDGQPPAKDEGWVEVWAQLGGTILSIWDMKQIQEASKQGKEVPPTYVNMTDAFVQVLGSVTVPATTTTPSKRYSNVLTLNTAGSNLLLFSCPSTAALISWAAALRVSAWEKSRLEEIYTAHLIRITLSARDTPTTLIHGRIEGWALIRIAGQTDWKRMWMVVNSSASNIVNINPTERPSTPGSIPQRKKRMSTLFSRDNSPPQNPLPDKPTILMYASPKPKDRKKPVLSITNVTQAFAVYPERPELIERSTLIKVEGFLGDEPTAGMMSSREGWLLIMPELETGFGQSAEMLKWILALHDAFELYGRPNAWTWDPRDPLSLMFAYPVGPHKDLLFLDRELAETLDPRDDRTSSIRSQFLNILVTRMRGNDVAPKNASSNPLPSLPSNEDQNGSASGPHLPPLNFGAPVRKPERTPLTPITELSSVATHGRGQSQDAPTTNQTLPSGTNSGQEATSVLGGSVTKSPPSSPQQLAPAPLEKEFTSPTTTGDHDEVNKAAEMSRFEFGSAAMSGSIPRASNDSLALSPNPANVRLPKSLPVSPESEKEPTTIVASQQTPEPVLSRGSPPSSVLTSPYSVDLTHADHGPTAGGSTTSPYDGMQPNPGSMSSSVNSRALPSSVTGSQLDAKPPLPTAARPTSADDSHNISSEAGALYFMQQLESKASVNQQARVNSTISEGKEPPSESNSKVANTTSPDHHPPSLIPSTPEAKRSPPLQQSTSMSFERRPSESSSLALNSTDSSLKAGLGRKPSGARAPPLPRSQSGDSAHPPQLSEEDSGEDSMDDVRARIGAKTEASSSYDDSNLDALAALSYLEDKRGPSPPPDIKVEPLKLRVTDRTSTAPSPPPSAGSDAAHYKSSFAPSKQATERKAKAQAQQAAHDAAVHKPGRANGKRKSKAVDKGAWNESSEEEDEEEEDDDDADSDGEPVPVSKTTTPTSGLVSLNGTPGQTPQSQAQGPPSSDPAEVQAPQASHSHLRPLRTLPQIPGGRPHPEADDYHSIPRRLASDQYSDAGRRTYYDDGGRQIRSQAEFNPPGAARQSVWSQVLDPGRTPGPPPDQLNNRDTFVQLEPASQTMTKAFTPQGLLSAGLQDKQERSAKKQEELARESGASLINVPNKPPPPQTGLLGAITAHERERKREGGVGAALTEREREKRVAEERQRRFDDHQRQQLDQMQGGSMYGGQQFPGYNPMMANPMMMGMNPMMGLNPMMTGAPMAPMAPMMTGQMGQMGYPGMMPGYNPQHMFAAQQAAHAYQQAMMAFSVAGSQVGGEGGSPQLNPMMTGGNMAGFDPRMSMMGMPMMGTPQMGPPQTPLGMQMTGMSTFDPRFAPNITNSQPMNDPGLVSPGGIVGPPQAQFSSRTSSPAGRGSPLGRPAISSRPTSPKP